MFKFSVLRQHNFNPRSPYGERLQYIAAGAEFVQISIHAPLTGSDYSRLGRTALRSDFNPRSPYGERRLAICAPDRHLLFQSTLPLRGATVHVVDDSGVLGISIHAPLTGSDCFPPYPISGRRHFNPRSPYGERPRAAFYKNYASDISIHAPLTGSDCFSRLPFPR